MGEIKKSKKKIIISVIIILLVILAIGAYFAIKNMSIWSRDVSGRYIVQAENYTKDRDYSEALKLYDKVLALDIFDKESAHKAHLGKGKIYEDKGHLDEALDEYKRAENLFKDRVEPEIYIGEIYLAKGEYEKAETDFNNVLNKESGNARALLGLGRVKMHQNNLKEAEKYLKDSVDKEPTQEAYFYLALVLAGDDLDKAADYLSKASEENGDLDEQIKVVDEEFQKMSKTALIGAYNSTLLGWIYIKIDEPLLAKYQFEKALSEEQDYRDAMVYKGFSQVLLGDYDGAIETVNQSFKVDPKYGMSFYVLARAYEGKKDFQKVEENFKKAIDLKYSNFQIHYDFAKFYESQKDYQNAEKQYLEALKYNENDLQANEDLFWLYTDSLSQYQSAITYAKKLVDFDENQGYYKGLSALAYFKNGDTDKADNLIKEAINLDYYTSSAYYAQGLIDLSQNNKKSAQQNFRKAIDYDLDGKIAKRADEEIKKL